MQAKYLNKEKDFVEVQLEGADEGIAHMIVEKLLERKGVSFAAANLVHPLITTPVITVRASDAKKELVHAVEAVETGIKDSLKEAKKV